MGPIARSPKDDRVFGVAIAGRWFIWFKWEDPVGAYDIELVLDAPDAAVERADVELALEFTAAERGVALRINRLPQVKRVGIGDIHTSGTTVACVAVQPAEDEAVELGVIAG